MPTYEYECKQFNPSGRVPRAAVSYGGSICWTRHAARGGDGAIVLKNK